MLKCLSLHMCHLRTSFRDASSCSAKSVKTIDAASNREIGGSTTRFSFRSGLSAGNIAPCNISSGDVAPLSILSDDIAALDIDSLDIFSRHIATDNLFAFEVPSTNIAALRPLRLIIFHVVSRLRSFVRNHHLLMEAYVLRVSQMASHQFGDLRVVPNWFRVRARIVAPAWSPHKCALSLGEGPVCR